MASLGRRVHRCHHAPDTACPLHRRSSLLYGPRRESVMLRVDHVVFPVWDAKASLAFYRDVLGFSLNEVFSGDDWGGFPWLMMIFAPGDGREIVLVALKGAKKPKGDGLARDVRHLAFAESSVKALAKWRKK